MRSGGFVLGLALVLAGCGPRARDSVVGDACAREPEAKPPSPSAAGLASALPRARQVVAGRVRFTGTATKLDESVRRDFRYVVVDTDEFLRGDPWLVATRYRRSFPLLAPVGPEPAATPLDGLACRQGESFIFFVELPGPGNAESDAERPPEPVARAFGPYPVKLIAIAPASDRARVMAALERAP